MFGKHLWRVSHLLANGLSLPLGEAETKIYKRSLQALLYNATRGFAIRMGTNMASPNKTLQICENHFSEYLAYETLY